MLQSIKVDVIYFNIPTDFEMEFNLGGCCRMRLLADKANDGKEFIRLLSRAVSRSRVIICCGPLFGDAGLISGVASAISRPLAKADNAAFGIPGDQDISIIDGSMPLVTKDGVFGGCVIESGPQSIILLTESKSVRKTLMSSLIHPYIDGLSRKSTAPGTVVTEPQNPIPAEDPATEEAAEAPEVTASVPPAVDVPLVVPTAADAEAELDLNTLATEEAPPESEEQPTEPDSEENETVEETVEDVAEETAEIQPEFIEAEVPTEETESAEEPTEETEGEETLPDDAVEESSESDETVSETAEDGQTDEEADEEADFSVPLQEKPNMELFIDPNDVVFNHKKYYEMYYEAAENLVGANNGNYVEPPKKRFRLPILILLIVLVVGLLFLGYFLVARPLINGTSISENFSRLLSGEVPVSWLM